MPAPNQTTYTSAQLADLVGGELVGPGDLPVTGVAALALAGPGDVSFLGDERYRPQVLPSAAGVVLIPAVGFETPPPEGRAWIKCAEPGRAFAGLVPRFVAPPPDYPAGVHPSAVVHPEARIAPSAHVGPLAVVEAGAEIGAGSVVGGGAYIGLEATVGEACHIHPNVTIRERCRLGNRVVVHAGTVIGSDGFGYEQTPAGHRKIPQVGYVQIDDDVEVGALVAVDRARFGRTWVKQGVKIDNLVQIAHNVVIHEHAMIIAQVGISGSTSIGAGCVLAGQAGVAGHLSVGAGTMLGGRGGIIKDVPPGSQLMGMPAVDKREYVKQLTAHKGVERCRKEIAGLKAEIAELKALLAGRA